MADLECRWPCWSAMQGDYIQWYDDLQQTFHAFPRSFVSVSCSTSAISIRATCAEATEAQFCLLLFHHRPSHSRKRSTKSTILDDYLPLSISFHSCSFSLIVSILSGSLLARHLAYQPFHIPSETTQFNSEFPSRTSKHDALMIFL